ncbi:hypothetical protein ACFMPD_05340 [Sedimentitalea sp. HM32M-2]
MARNSSIRAKAAAAPRPTRAAAVVLATVLSVPVFLLLSLIDWLLL